MSGSIRQDVDPIKEDHDERRLRETLRQCHAACLAAAELRSCVRAGAEASMRPRFVHLRNGQGYLYSVFKHLLGALRAITAEEPDSSEKRKKWFS